MTLIRAYCIYIFFKFHTFIHDNCTTNILPFRKKSVNAPFSLVSSKLFNFDNTIVVQYIKYSDFSIYHFTLNIREIVCVLRKRLIVCTREHERLMLILIVKIIFRGLTVFNFHIPNPTQCSSLLVYFFFFTKI